MYIYLKSNVNGNFIFAVCIAQACSSSSECGLRDRPSVVEIELKLSVREP